MKIVPETQPESEFETPFVVRNWKALISSQNWHDAWEYPIFSDAHITGMVTNGFGPNQVFNALPMGSLRPALILRIQHHFESKMPEMIKTQDKHYHAGDEAEEFAALLSLCLGIRAKASTANRMFLPSGDPRGQPISYPPSNDPVISMSSVTRGKILNSALGTHSLDDADPIKSIMHVSNTQVIALVRAARLYQEAVWIVESTPELAWIMLVSSVEVVAEEWKKSKFSPLDNMEASHLELLTFLREYGGNNNNVLVERVANEFARSTGATKKFREFLLEFLPSLPNMRPPSHFQHEWNRTQLKKSFDKIYSYRSRALHSGHPFPAPMCMPPNYWAETKSFDEIPAGLGFSSKGAYWKKDATPMNFHIFEYIARNAILKWWQSISQIRPLVNTD